MSRDCKLLQAGPKSVFKSGLPNEECRVEVAKFGLGQARPVCRNSSCQGALGTAWRPFLAQNWLYQLCNIFAHTSNLP
jgi:hypothetical protein